MVDLLIGSIHDTNKEWRVGAHVLNKLTGKLPARDMGFCSTAFLQKRFKLADPDFSVPSEVDMVLGAYHCFELIGPGKYYQPRDGLWIQESHLGWLVCGGALPDPVTVLHTHCSVVEDQDQLLEKFWLQEEPPIIKTVSPDDIQCESIFEKTIVRKADGRYGVALPMRTNQPVLGESYDSALRRFYSVERAMARDAKFKSEYLKFMLEYESLDHMRLIAEEEINLPVSQRYYIPHHGIFQQSNDKSKLRIVFDASMASNGGNSLNDILLRGPNLQLELSDILTNFRLHTYVFVSDITKMYRQILINESSQDFQRILWRESSELPVKHYRLRTVTYGECCSPYLALKTLLRLASDEEKNYPAGARVIRQNRYMDDFLVGADDLTELLGIRDELINILLTAGMSLGKWASNDNRVLRGISESDRTSPDFSSMDDTIFLKTLGIRWNPSGDYFSFNYTSIPIAELSKRSLLSEGSRIFDPLGWISPVILLFKILFQETWIRGVGWDDSLPTDMKERWSALRGSLKNLRDVKLPRWVGNVTNAQIHGFCDASERAYAAVIYLRSTDQSGVTISRLISAKNKLAPIKTISIAKLELCAAHLLARMLNHLKNNVAFSGVQCFALSDSKIVLAWLSTHPSKWKTFVANRCSHIQELCPGLRWSHVRSKNNPADIASRGAFPDQLISNEAWWSGPEWLSEFNSADRSVELFTTDEQQRSLVLGLVCTPSDFFTDFVGRFSSFIKLTRSFSYLIHACNLFKNHSHGKVDDLTPDIIQEATLILVRGIQRSYYSREFDLLERGFRLSRQSGLFHINPFLGDDGVLKVGGRLANSPLSFMSKFPIVIPKGHFLDLLISFVHHKYFHCGVSLVMSIIRQRFWSPGLRNRIKGHIRQCVTCLRQRAVPFSPSMGHVPDIRFYTSKPFDRAGIDFAGPYNVRPYRGRGKIGMKAYLAIIICLTTKAVHLELVYNLSTDSLILALQRFIARRRHCSEMMSDNGRNFLGLSRCLSDSRKEISRVVMDEALKKFMLENLMKWKFIPPYSPHFGGIWESAVRSVKTHLNKSINDQILTLEEMTTVLTQIEAILNSRPISAVTDEVEDFEVLTPAHLLGGHPAVDLPIVTCNQEKKPISDLRAYNNLKSRITSFWRNWRHSYMQALTQKSKWVSGGRSPEIGELVLIKRTNDPPTYWHRGRIVRLFPGVDGKTRVVEVKTAKGITKESARNLVPLNLKLDASTGGNCKSAVASKLK